MLALSTVGMDKVQVVLVADPTVEEMRTLVAFRGKAGELDIKWQGVPSEVNPSTSKDVALNVIKAIDNICSSVKLGV
jgi:aspartate dehydrogenase